MIVVDASAVVMSLVEPTAQGEEARRLLTEVHATDPWFAPEHLLLECAQALRGMALGGKVSLDDLTAARAVVGRFAVNTDPRG